MSSDGLEKNEKNNGIIITQLIAYASCGYMCRVDWLFLDLHQHVRKGRLFARISGHAICYKRHNVIFRCQCATFAAHTAATNSLILLVFCGFAQISAVASLWFTALSVCRSLNAASKVTNVCSYVCSCHWMPKFKAFDIKKTYFIAKFARELLKFEEKMYETFRKVWASFNKCSLVFVSFHQHFRNFIFRKLLPLIESFHLNRAAFTFFKSIHPYFNFWFSILSQWKQKTF